MHVILCASIIDSIRGNFRPPSLISFIKETRFILSLPFQIKLYSIILVNLFLKSLLVPTRLLQYNTFGIRNVLMISILPHKVRPLQFQLCSVFIRHLVIVYKLSLKESSQALVPQKMVNFDPGLSQLLSKVFLTKDTAIRANKHC